MLLDTQALIWLLGDLPKLGADARRRIVQSPSVFVSTASVWEITIKAGTGKLQAPDDLLIDIADAGLLTLAVVPEHAWAVRTLTGLAHRDPFDRLLVAQSSYERMPFVTADRALLSASVTPAVEMVDARR